MPTVFVNVHFSEFFSKCIFLNVHIFLNVRLSEKMDKNLILIHEIKTDSSFNKSTYLMLCRKIRLEHWVRRDTVGRGALVRNIWNLQPLFYPLITTILSVALRIRAICKKHTFHLIICLYVYVLCCFFQNKNKSLFFFLIVIEQDVKDNCLRRRTRAVLILF